MAKTSTTHPLRIDAIPFADGAKLGLTLCPGKKQTHAATGAWDRDLALDLQAILDWGAKAVVTLMEDHELHRFKVPGMGDEVEAKGMDWYPLPIQDGGVPDASFERAWSYAGHRLRSLLTAGKREVVHCLGGLGRTGTIGARLLVDLGWSPQDAIIAVRKARPGAIETPTQERYVLALERSPIPDCLTARILGCILGGAVGDAFGYEIEFDSLATIRNRFGHDGIRYPILHDGQLIVSDDTQMSLFTAEGLLRAMNADKGADVVQVISEIRQAYLDWLLTQGSSWNQWQPAGRLCTVRTMRQRRAPGNTCMSALQAGGRGTVDARANDSKGCGGVMRTAPIGLITAWDERTAFEVGARASAITHGHPSGYLSGGAMAAIVRSLIGGADLGDAAAQTIEIARTWGENEETVSAIRLAFDLAKKPDQRPEDAIRLLGQGWVGEEALAIGLYAALVGGSFTETLVIAANHDGDSDSTASIAGQLFGAWKGVTEIPHAWVRRLDVIEPIYEVLDGLLSAYSQSP